MRTTTTYRFDGPSVPVERRGQCPTCGVAVTRRRTFSRTVNPFNKRADGEIKSWDEVYADVKAEAQAWSPEPLVFEHQRCYDARHAPEPAGYEPVPEDVVAAYARERDLAERWISWTASTGLPIAPVPDNWHTNMTDTGAWVFVLAQPRWVCALADSLGVTEVAIRRTEGYLDVRFIGRTSDGSIEVETTASVDPKRVERPKGDTMTVDELAAWIETTGQVQYSRRNR